MKFKNCPAFRTKAADTKADDVATFEAIVSVFNNPDWYGDVVLPGAFAETLAEWKSSGDPIPVLWSHNMANPLFNIGMVLEADELEAGDPRLDADWLDPFVKANGGLWVRGQLDQGAEASEIATAARRLLKARRVTQFSYAYDVVDGGWGQRGGEDVYELRTLKLYEVSPTQIGANDLTELLDAKAGSGAPTAERVAKLLSSLDKEELREAIALFGKALADNDGKESPPAKDEEPTEAKSEEPAADESRRLLESLTFMELESAIA
jgi:phage head maturation protease